MASERLHIDADDVVARYQAGASTNEIAGQLGISKTPVIRILRARGVVLRGRRLSVPVEHIVADYVVGLSENAVAKKYGLARTVVRRRLTEARVEIRNQSEAETLKWSQMSSAERRGQVASAHAATRGRRARLSELVRRAKTNEKRGRSTLVEVQLAELLEKRGIHTVAQIAIGPYNCDLGAAPVAVEVFGGNWHWSGKHLRRTPRRIRYLLDSGWHVLIVNITRNTFPLTETTADHVASYIQQARRNPTATRKYRVIRSTGELVTEGSSEDENISIETPYTSRRNPTNGQYERISREA